VDPKVRVLCQANEARAWRAQKVVALEAQPYARGNRVDSNHGHQPEAVQEQVVGPVGRLRQLANTPANPSDLRLGATKSDPFRLSHLATFTLESGRREPIEAPCVVAEQSVRNTPRPSQRMN